MNRGISIICIVLALSMPAYAVTMTPYWNVGVGGDGEWKADISGHGPAYIACPLNVPDVIIIENNSGGYPDGQMQGLGQQFSLTSDISLKSISIKTGGISAGNYGMALYDIGPSSNYTSITPDPLDLSVLTPEFSATFSSTGLSTSQVVAFNMSGGTINLYGGEKYAFVITETVGYAFTWLRSSPHTLNAMAITTMGGGSGMNIWKNLLDFGGPPQTDTARTRDFMFAIYSDNVIPEPVTMALLGFGGIIILKRKRG
jgi:hypothetical protein